MRIAVLLCLAAWAAGTRADDATAVIPEADLATLDGAAIYTHVCQGCHMPDGRGAVGAGHYPALAGDAALYSWEYAARVILNGRADMPAFARVMPNYTPVYFRSVHLSDAQVADLVNYLRSHFGNHFKGTVSAQQVASLPHPDIK